jgi:ATP phosphoribosyltransferase regulatory subunit
MTYRTRWILPDAIEDILPAEARHIETLRRLLLDGLASRGYEFIVPPMLGYIESLVTGSSDDLDLRTFKLVDQLSGRTLGVRADITPQVARIDAHLLNRKGITRLCYCGTVLHTLPAGFNATREPLQFGAEIYGHAGIEADIEIVWLLSETLRLCSLEASRIDLGHVGIFHALTEKAGLDTATEQQLFSALQAKNIPELQALTQSMEQPIRSALLALPDLYGGRDVLQRARDQLPPLPQIIKALDDLQQLADIVPSLPIGFDLSDLRGYNYHSGIVFAAYHKAASGAIALGGRYDEVGAAYGRARPATGFSMDLREIARLMPLNVTQSAILAPWDQDDRLNAEVIRLRDQGEIVVRELPGHEGTWQETGCDRQLVRRGKKWLVEPLSE